MVPKVLRQVLDAAISLWEAKLKEAQRTRDTEQFKKATEVTQRYKRALADLENTCN